MLKRLLLTTVAVAFAIGMGYADQSRSKITIPVTKTSPTSGHEMYANYCAPCHGTDGRGKGPAAAALKVPPTDLTVLSRNNHGKFPDTHVVSVMQFGTGVQAHGSENMPIWGPILGHMSANNAQDKQLRISNLSRYLQSIQAK
ncbi:MAG: cytochrome c [Terracidiphilus sp.]|nr:cytochrome c [Terracidiphilus sp.]